MMAAVDNVTFVIGKLYQLSHPRVVTLYSPRIDWARGLGSTDFASWHVGHPNESVTAASDVKHLHVSLDPNPSPFIVDMTVMFR
jgi:hypothetical protein